MLNEKEVNEEIVRTKQDDIISPSVNISESGDFYKVEIALPGVNRENFLVYRDKNILSVCVVHKGIKKIQMTRVIFLIHEFNYNCFERHLELPADADTKFVRAEYKEGVLRIYIPSIRAGNSSAYENCGLLKKNLH